ncbi:MAG: hypothetical protein AAFQ94_19035 [Bacteroidota bacterium]
MKTVKTQNTKGIKRTVITLILAVVVMAGSVSAISKSKSKNADASETELAEEAIREQRKNAELLEELSNLYNIEQDDFEEIDLELPAYEIYDAEDNLVYSATEKQWADESNDELSKMKRKSEFLFESSGTKIYKVF